MKRRAIIWLSVPHEVDGICVEIEEQFSKKRPHEWVTIENRWFQTFVECQSFSAEMGALEVVQR